MVGEDGAERRHPLADTCLVKAHGHGWSTIAAVESGTPAPVLAAALFGRFTSRGEADFADRVLSGMRFGFGGHREKRG